MGDRRPRTRRDANRWITSGLVILAIAVPVLAAVFRLGPMVTGPTRWLLRGVVILLPLIAVMLVWRRLRGEPRQPG